MKPLTIILGAVCLAICLSSSGSTGAAQATFPLTCMPSRDYVVGVNVYDAGTTSAHAEVILTFQRSAGNAAAGLRPGQCAWSDRRVADSEPNFVCANLPINRPGTRLAVGNFAATGGTRFAFTLDGFESAFSRLMVSGPPITFRARQVAWLSVPGGRCLEMTPLS